MQVSLELRVRGLRRAGGTMAAGSVKLEAFFSPEVAEAVAIYHGIQLAIDSGLSPLFVESDALGVINILKSGSIPSSDLGLDISDIFNICSRSNVLSFSFIPRAANKVADALARATCFSDLNLFWIESCPFIWSC
ncbi:hypothetical protein ACOSP7_008365 [Xanthoceras sorbifolium]